MNKLLRLLILIILIYVLQAPIFAQTKIQVVTRTIQKSFSFKLNCVVDVNAEKAKILIKKSVGNNINIRLSLISKNTSLEIAEKDLQYCYYQIDQIKNDISIANFFNIKTNNEPITSTLSVKLEIEIPDGTAIKLKDRYGEVEMNGTNGNFNFFVDFGKIKYNNISGNLIISSNCSDISGNNTNATVTIDAQKADINITSNKSEQRIKNKYGSVIVVNPLADSYIDSKMTEVNITVDNIKKYALDISVTDGELIVPKEYDRVMLHYMKILNSNEKKILTDGNYKLSIITTYNNVTINQK